MWKHVFKHPLDSNVFLFYSSMFFIGFTSFFKSSAIIVTERISVMAVKAKYRQAHEGW